MKILFISLGCDKNLTDSEKMINILSGLGHTFTDNEAEAEAAIINTCSFISDAKEESINEILRIAGLKEDGCLKKLLITGCLAQRYREEIKKELPEVDGMLGIAGWDRIGELVSRVADGEYTEIFPPLSENTKPSEKCLKRHISTGGHYAFLKIAEGCNKGCTYCRIPAIRGRYNSIPMETLISEACYLASEGVKELILIAQETTVYGVDLYGRKALPELVTKLSSIDGIEMIRLMYCYPEEITKELVEVIKNDPKVCHYLDIPIQHTEDRILKAMGRRTTRRELADMIRYIRSEIPDMVFRTTLIAGFPSETEEEHESLMEFINEMEFDHLGVFAYSPEEGTPAAQMDGQTDEKTKKRYADEIMELQQEISEDRNRERVGMVLKVIVEGRIPEEDCYAGRSYIDAPGVDGFVFFNTDRQLMTGDMVELVVTGYSEYDLTGVLKDEYTE